MFCAVDTVTICEMTGWMLTSQPSQWQENSHGKYLMAKHTQRWEEKHFILKAICTSLQKQFQGICLGCTQNRKYQKLYSFQNIFYVQKIHGLTLLKMYTKFKPHQNEFVGLFKLLHSPKERNESGYKELPKASTKVLQ